MKSKRPRFAPLSSSIARLCSVISVVTASIVPQAQAANDLYWDTNGVTAGSGATTGIWGINSFWNTDSTGGAGAFSIGTTSLNDLHFSAGTNATAGLVGLWGPFPLAANGIVFEENVAVSVIGSNNASGIVLGAGNSGITVSGGVSAATTLAAPLFLNASTSLTNSGTGLFTVNAPVALASNAGLTISGPGATTVSGVISGGTAFGTTGLTINGGATATLANTGNTFRGNIAIDGAGSTLNYTGTTTTTTSQLGLGNGLGYKQVVLTNGGTFRLSAADFNDNIPTTTNLAAGVIFNVGTGGGGFDVSLGRTLTLDDGAVSNITGTLAAQLQGSGTLTKTGTGTLSLGNGTSNFSGFTGAIIVSEGVLQTGAVSTSPFGSTAAGTTVMSGASVNVAGVSIGAEPLTLTGSGFGGRGALYSSAANGSESGPITLSGDTTFGATTAAAGLTISGVVTGGAFNITKVGPGAVGFNQTNLGTGTLTVKEGSLNVNGLNGRFTNTTGVTVGGAGTLNIGDATAGNGVANRINAAASLTLGGAAGSGSVVFLRGATVANSQSFTGLTVASGLNTITNNGTTGGLPVLTFSGANPYTRNIGGIVNFASTANVTTTFTSAPSGATNITGGATPILIGGIVNSDNFAAAAAGTVGATTYTANTFGTGINTQITGATAPAADSVTQSLAFGAGANTVTLSGTNTIESGGILVQTAATSGTITGGNLQAPAGRDLWVFMNGKPLTIASSIVENGGSSLTVGGASTLTLTASNTYTGNTLVHNGATLLLNNSAANDTTVIGSLTIGSHSAATVNLGANNQLADTTAVVLNGGPVTGQSAALNLQGFNETISSLATTTNPLGSASLIQNNTAAGASILTINGSSATTYDGIIRNGAAGTVGIALAGTTNLTLTNTANVATISYTGTTNIGAGTTLNMFDGNGGTIASFVSPTTNNGTLTLNNVSLGTTAATIAANRTTAAPIGGGGTININANTSTITLTGALTHTGPTNINSGTLIISNAGVQSLAGLITGAGGLSQTGAGALTISNSANSYSGATSVTTGPLVFAGHSLPSGSAVTVGATGTLSILDDGAGSNGTIAYGNNITPTSATGTINVGANGGANTGNTVAFGLLTPTVVANNTAFTGANGYKISFAGITLPPSTGQGTILNPTTTSVSILGDVTNSMINYGTGNFDTLQLDGTSTGNSIAGNISDAIGGSFVNPLLGGYTRVLKTNSSTWTLSGTGSSYSGFTQVQGGTLVAAGNNVIPLTNLQGIQIANAAASATAVYDLGTNSQTLNTLSGTGNAIAFSGAAATNAGTITGGVGSALTINGNVSYSATNNPLGATISVATLDLGGGNRTFNIGDSTTAAIDTAVTSLVQNGTLTKTGAGSLQLTQVPTANVILTAGVLDLNGNTLTTFTTNGGGTVQNGTISGASFLKQGPGTLTLAATTTGVTTLGISQGLIGTTANPATVSTINVNFAGVGMPAANPFSSSAALTLGGSGANLVAGGGIQLTGAASGTNSQTFASTLIDAGANAAGATIGAGGTVALNLGTVTRNVGGTVDFTIPAGTQSATNGIIVGGTPTAGTLVTSATGAAYATAGGNDWAANSTVSANNIVAASVAGAASASIYTTATTAGTFSGNADVTASFTANSDATVNSIRVNTGTVTLTLAGTNTVTTGGILIGNGTAGVTTITGGNIQPGAGVGELALIINKPNVQAVFSSVIQDNGATPTTLTFRGSPNAGTTGSILGLIANNTYTGGTYVTSGRLQVLAPSTATTPFGTGTVYVDGNADGQAFINTNTTIANPFVVVGNGFNEAGTRRGVIRLDSAAANTPTLTGAITLLGDSTIHNNAAITGAGAAIISGNIGTSNSAGATTFTLSKTGTGVLKLSGINSQTNTNIAGGILNVNADAALGIAGAPITFNAGALQYQNSFAIAAARPMVLTGAGTIDTTLLGTTSTTLANVISGAGALTKGNPTAANVLTNSAPLILTGDNTFTGNVTVNHGWLTATSSTSFGLGAKTIAVTAGTAGDVQLHLDPSLGNTPSVGIDLPAGMAVNISNTLVAGVSNAISNDSGNNIIRGTITNTSGGGGGTINSTSGTLTLAGNITTNTTGRALFFRGNGNIVSTGAISDGSTFQLPVTRDVGTGTLTLAGPNTYAGATTISAGSVKVGNPLALGFGGITTTPQVTFAGQSNLGTSVAAGATLDLGGTAGINEVITLNGTGLGAAGALINSVAGTTAVLEGNLASAAVSVPGTNAGTTAVTIAGGGGSGAVAVANLGVSTASYTITNAGAGYTSVPTVAITAGGGANATATVTLSGGTTGTVTGLTITNPGTGFNAAATYTLTGGGATTAAVLTGAFAYQVNSVSVVAPGTGYTSAPTFTIGNATSTPQLSAVVLASDSTVGGVGDITIGGVVSGTAALTKVGNGRLTLNGANTFANGLNVNGGIVSATVIGAPGAGTVTVNPTGTFIAGAAHTNNFVLAGGTMGTRTGPTFAGSITAATSTTSTVVVADPTATATESEFIVTGTLGGSGNINVVAGTSALTPDGRPGFRLRGVAASTYSGTVTVGAGAKFELQTTVAGPFSPLGTGKVVVTGGTFTNDATPLDGTYPEFVARNNSAGSTTLGNDVEFAGTGLAVINTPSTAPAGSITTLGNLKIGANQILGPNRNAGNSQVIEFTSVTLTGGNATFAPNTLGVGFSGSADLKLGAIGQSASSGIIMDGQATLTLAAANNYSGSTTIQRGTTKLGAAGALPATTALTVTGGTLDFNNGGTSNSQTVASLAGTGGIITNSDITERGMTVNETSGSTEYSGVISGALAVTKQGAGTLILSGLDTYTGATTVDAAGGTLIINGSLSGSAVTVNGGVLGGSGIITQSVTVNTGGTLAPGNSPGILSTGSLNLASGSTFAVELNGATVGTGYDQVNVTGGITLAGSLTLSLGYTPAPSDVFWIGLNDGVDSVSGAFSNVPVTDVGNNSGIINVSGNDYTVFYSADFGTGAITGGNDILVVPEPGSAALLLGGLALLAGRRRRSA